MLLLFVVACVFFLIYFLEQIECDEEKKKKKKKKKKRETKLEILIWIYFYLFIYFFKFQISSCAKIEGTKKKNWKPNKKQNKTKRTRKLCVCAIKSNPDRFLEKHTNT